MTTSISRRRLLTICAAGAGMPIFFPGASLALAGELARENDLVRWDGVALGARSEIFLNMPDPSKGAALLERVVLEIGRLEKIFSLYRGDSAVVELNREGKLAGPPPEMVELLSHAREMSEATQGAFDITVQPLWQLYSEYGDKPISSRLVQQVLKLVDYRSVDADLNLVRFARPGMAITLNGIAQGYITDRITRLLRHEGLENALVQLGETNALGAHPSGRPWLVGIKDPEGAGKSHPPVPLENMALATSGGYGTLLPGARNHIFNPKSGESPKGFASLTVIAKNATTADALSTGFISMSQGGIETTLKSFPGVSVRFVKET